MMALNYDVEYPKLQAKVTTLTRRLATADELLGEAGIEITWLDQELVSALHLLSAIRQCLEIHHDNQQIVCGDCISIRERIERAETNQIQKKKSPPHIGARIAAHLTPAGKDGGS